MRDQHTEVFRQHCDDLSLDAVIKMITLNDTSDSDVLCFIRLLKKYRKDLFTKALPYAFKKNLELFTIDICRSKKDPLIEFVSSENIFSEDFLSALELFNNIV